MNSNQTPDYYYRTRMELGYMSLRSRQPLSLKGHHITTARQARHRGSQMSVLATSSENFQ